MMHSATLLLSQRGRDHSAVLSVTGVGIQSALGTVLQADGAGARLGDESEDSGKRGR